MAEIFLPLLRRFNPAEPEVEKSVILPLLRCFNPTEPVVKKSVIL